MLDLTASSHVGLYRSGLTGPDHRRHITVGRSEIFEDAIEILRRNLGKKPKHHQLFIGSRGIGKTHLLSLLEDEIHRDEKLNEGYHVVRFPEESHRTLSFADFMLGMCENLRDTLPKEKKWADLHDQLATEESDAVIIDTLVPAIRRRWRDSGQALVVMLENLNQVFEEQIKNEQSIAALRGFLMEDNGCLLIATAPIHFGAITDPKKPFYDFFDVQILEQLSDEQTIELIRRNLEWEKKTEILSTFDELRPRLLSLYRMTGGSPRLTLMLYELIANESITEVKKQFYLLLDRITPFYQDRMNDLGSQERALLETMAVMRDQPKTPTAIAERLRMKPQQVSTLLGRLTRSHYLKSSENPKDKRSRFYTIREGFFDIWLAMNVSRGERARLPFLLDFFTLFYPTLEDRNLKRRELREILHMDDGDTLKVRESGAIESLDYLSEVAPIEEWVPEKLRVAAVRKTRGETEMAQRYADEAKVLAPDEMGGWIVERVAGAEAPDYLADVEMMIESWEANRTGELEAFAAKIREIGEGLTLASWSEAKIEFLEAHLDSTPLGEERVVARLRLGQLLVDIARWSEAEFHDREALREAESIDDVPLISWALNDLAQLYTATNRLEEAERLMERALKIDEASYGENHPNVATDLNNLAQLYTATNRPEEAEPLMERALAIDEASYGKDHPTVAIFLNNLAMLLKGTNRMEEAEVLMERALAINEASYGKDHPTVAIFLSNLAMLLKGTNRLEEAEVLMERALAIDEASYGKDHPTVATRLNNLAQLLKGTNRMEEAEALMERALAIDEASYGKDHPTVAIGLNNLAQLLQDTNRIEEAEAIMERALRVFLRFAVATGYSHPFQTGVLQNYSMLCSERLYSEETVLRRIGKIGIEVGLDAVAMKRILSEALSGTLE